MNHVHAGGHPSSGMWSYRNLEAAVWRWEPNLGSLQEQQEHITTEPCLQPYTQPFEENRSISCLLPFRIINSPDTSQSTYQPAYQLTYQPIYLPTYLQTYLLTSLPTFLST